MALPPLATVTDLSDRGIDVTNVALINDLLAAASAAVREPAGVPISKTTGTVKLPTLPGRRLRLPATPVRSVATVLLDGEEITDWLLRGDSLWRRCGWQGHCDLPRETQITFTAGLDEVPADIVDLVCNLVGAGVNHAAEGYEAKTGKEYESVDDYRVGYGQDGGSVVSGMELPVRTRNWLASRFGRGATMVVSRS